MPMISSPCVLNHMEYQKGVVATTGHPVPRIKRLTPENNGDGRSADHGGWSKDAGAELLLARNAILSTRCAKRMSGGSSYHHSFLPSFRGEPDKQAFQRVRFFFFFFFFLFFFFFFFFYYRLIS